MNLLRSKRALLAYRARLAAQRTLGFVPTMGYLHEGHLELMRVSARENTETLVSIFVNPTQFAPDEDFAEYPRALKQDLALAKACGVNSVFLPKVRDIYPGGTGVSIEQPQLTSRYCGITRPHFYSGGMTVVAKLFNLVRPHRAYFGKKDYQQLFLFKQMTRELAFPVQLRAIPTVRTKAGLALSSRNVYLTTTEQLKAAEFYQLLRGVKKRFWSNQGTEVAAAQFINAIKRGLTKLPFLRLDYAAIAARATLLPVSTVQKGKCVLLGAVFFLAADGKRVKVRLIDNIEL